MPTLRGGHASANGRRSSINGRRRRLLDCLLKGRKAVEGKGQWWYANHEVHNVKVEGPYVHGDQFVVRFKMEVTPKGKQPMNLDEVGLYTVQNGKIVEERFFIGGLQS